MRNKRTLFFGLPIMVVAIAFIVIMWLEYFMGEAFYENFDVVNTVIGILFAVGGFYVSIVIFLASEDAEKETFWELLKGIGFVIGFGFVGLVLYSKGISYLSGITEASWHSMYDIMVYGTLALAIINVIGIVRLFNSDYRQDVTLKTCIKRILLAVSAVVGLYMYYTQFNQLMILVALSLFVLSVIDHYLFTDRYTY